MEVLTRGERNPLGRIELEYASEGSLPSSLDIIGDTREGTIPSNAPRMGVLLIVGANPPVFASAEDGECEVTFTRADIESIEGSMVCKDVASKGGGQVDFDAEFTAT
jgi:hypothetical protein